MEHDRFYSVRPNPPAYPGVNGRPTVKNFPQKSKRLKTLILAIGIPLIAIFILVVGLLIFHNSGLYTIEVLSGGRDVVIYHGSIQKLLKSDYHMLSAFLEDGEVNGEKVEEIRCNNYIIINNFDHDKGTIDILDDPLFYEEGLQLYTVESADYEYDRFRDDYDIQIVRYSAWQEMGSALDDFVVIGEVLLPDLFSSDDHSGDEEISRSDGGFFVNSADVIPWIEKYAS